MKSKIDCIIPVSHSCNIIAYVEKLGVKYISGIVNNHCCCWYCGLDISEIREEKKLINPFLSILHLALPSEMKFLWICR